MIVACNSELPLCPCFAHLDHELLLRTTHPRVQALYNDIYDDLVGSYYDSSSSIGEDPAFGFMYISIALGSFSLTKLSDDNPINMLDFIANIGGFWGEYTGSSSPVNITRRLV